MASNPVIKKGICINVGNCQNANEKKLIEVAVGEDFVCPNPECGGNLNEVKEKEFPWKVVAIAVVVLLIAGAASYFLLSGEKAPSTIPVTQVSMDKETLSIAVDEGEALNVIIQPENATNNQVNWSSDSPEIVSVSANGHIKGLKAGNASVQVKTEDGGYTAICSVTVKEKQSGPGEGPDGRGTAAVTDGVGTITFPYGEYNGDIKNGKPHGNGTIEYTKSHKIISSKDYVASPGEKIIGSFREGRINLVTWYQKDGNQVVIK